MSGRGKSRGRGRGKAVTRAVTRSATKRSHDTASPGTSGTGAEGDAVYDSDSGDEGVTFRVRNDELRNAITETVTRLLPEILPDTIKQVLPASLNSVLPVIVSKVTDTAAKYMPLQNSQKDTREVNPVRQKAICGRTDDLVGGNEICNETSSNYSDVNKFKVSHDHVPLDIHLKPGQIGKISGYKYVKFGELLIKEQRDNEKMTLHIGGSDSSGQQIMVNPYHNQVKITHINQWDRAFSIFKYVLVKVHPEDAQGLIVYENLIKDMAFKGMNFLKYDRQFRQLKERNPSKYPWGSTEISLYAECITVPRSRDQVSAGQVIGQHYSQNQWSRNTSGQNHFLDFGSKGHGQNSVNLNDQGQEGLVQEKPRKKCFLFNGGYCKFKENCRFAHLCNICEEEHPECECDQQF